MANYKAQFSSAFNGTKSTFKVNVNNFLEYIVLFNF